MRQQIEPPADVAAEYKALYLSGEAVDNPGHGCPMPATGSDLARESAAVKAEFAAGLQRVIAALARGMDGTTGDQRSQAMREIALMVGAVLLARASDPETAEAMLTACAAPA